jgi:hypothetical protein
MWKKIQEILTICNNKKHTLYFLFLSQFKLEGSSFLQQVTAVRALSAFIFIYRD